MDEVTVKEDERGASTTAQGSDITTTVARSWALVDGEETRVEDVTETIELVPVTSVPLGELDETDADAIHYSEVDDGERPNEPTKDHLRTTVESEYAGRTASVYGEADFPILDAYLLHDIADGTVSPSETEFILLTQTSPPRGYVCRAVHANKTTIGNDGLGQVRTLTKHWYTNDGKTTHAQQLNQIEHQTGLLKHDGEYRVTVEPDPEENQSKLLIAGVVLGLTPVSLMSLFIGNWLLAGALSLIQIALLSSYVSIDNTDEIEVPLGTDQRDGLPQTAVASVAESIDDTRDPVEETEWVTVTFEKDDNIYARSVSDEREWVFETDGDVLASADDVAFFEQLGFNRIDTDKATLQAVSVTGPPDEAHWKLNQTGNWWLCPTTT